MRWLLCGFAWLCASGVTFAQSVMLSPADPKRWDATGAVGWVAGNKSDFAEDWNGWYDTFAASIDVGRYWTPHFKTEAGITFTTQGEVFSHQEHSIPGQPFPIFIPREHHFRVNAFAASATYQFFENTWVHPFLTAGVQFVEERERAFSPYVPFSGRGSERIDVPIEPPRQTTVFSVRPLAMGGAKFYMTERSFVRTDLGVTWGEGRVAHVSWRGGIGVDF